MITEDDEFERIEREIEQRKKKVDDDLMVVYSLRLTKSQRVKLLQLGGPTWIRALIDGAKEPRRSGVKD